MLHIRVWATWSAKTTGWSSIQHLCSHLDCLQQSRASPATLCAGKLKRNDKAMVIHKRMYLAPPEVPASEDGSPLLTNSVYKHVQVMLNRFAVAHSGEKSVAVTGW